MTAKPKPKKRAFKLTLRDASKRVSRLLHRTTPGGELIVLDLEAGFRGEGSLRTTLDGLAAATGWR